MGLSYFTDGLEVALLAEWSDIIAAEGGVVMANPASWSGHPDSRPRSSSSVIPSPKLSPR